MRSWRFGLTGVVVGFSTPMDPARVSDLGAYQLSTLRRGRRPVPVPVGISSATYDARTNSVTLKLIRPMRGGPLNLSISQTAVTSQDGLALNSRFSSRVS